MSGGNPVGATLPAGSGAWSGLSDRDAKENFSPVDGEDTLARLASVPIQTWNMKTQDPSIRHIGPMAQDFYAAFKVGEDERRINTIDADGVALSAIQGLNRIVQEKDARINQLEKQNAAQEEKINNLEARMAAIERQVGATTTEPTTASFFPAAGLMLAFLPAVAVAGWWTRRRGEK